MRKLILLVALAATMTGCSVNVIVAPRANLNVDSNKDYNRIAAQVAGGCLDQETVLLCAGDNQ